jgi:hypothetical protein
MKYYTIYKNYLKTKQRNKKIKIFAWMTIVALLIIIKF